MNDEIRCFLTTLGATVIGYLKEETPTSYKMRSALFISVQQNQNGIGPTISPIFMFPPNGDPNKGIECELNKTAVILTHDIADEIKQQYANAVSIVAIVGPGALTSIITKK